MRIPTLLLLMAFILSGCGLLGPKTSFPPLNPKARDIVTETENQTTGEIITTIVKAKTFIVDDSKPASFEDYKKWRREYDPGGQTYADFKEWEAAFGEWKLQQEQALK